jgi:hypothetical protein
LHQSHLTYGSGGLQLVEVFRALVPAQPGHTLSHGPGGHHYHFNTVPDEISDLVYPAGEGRHVETATIIGEQRTANLDHQAPGAAHLHSFCHGSEGVPGLSGYSGA